MADAVELKIYNQDDRLSVAAILIKNGYTVSQGKRQRRGRPPARRWTISSKYQRMETMLIHRSRR